MKRKQPRQELKPKRRQRVTAEQLVSAIIEAYEKDSEDLCDEHVDFTTHGPWLLVRLSDDCGWAGYCLFCVDQDRIDKFYDRAYAAWMHIRDIQYRSIRVSTFSCDASLVDPKDRCPKPPDLDEFDNPFVPEQAVQFCPCFAKKFFVRLSDDHEAEHTLTFCEQDLDSDSEQEEQEERENRKPRLELRFPALSYEATETLLVEHVLQVSVARLALDYLTCLHNLRSFTTFSCGCESD